MTRPSYQYTREQLEAMPTNEGLMSVGKSGAFEEAIDRRDLEVIRRILESVHVDEFAIAGTLADLVRQDKLGLSRLG